MRYILTGGGSGGHIYPLLSFAKVIKTMDAEAEFLFVGKKSNMEAHIVPEHGIPFAHVATNGTKGKITWQNVKAATSMAVGYIQAKKIIKTFKPDVCIGAGGYVSVPMMMAATKTSGVITAVYEFDQFIGRANLTLASKSDLIFSGLFDLSEKYFPNKSNYYQIGDPRSQELSMQYNDEIRKKSIDKKVKQITFAGGSLGAETINEQAIKLAEHYKQENISDINVMLITGRRYFEAYEKYNDTYDFLTVVPYVDPMASVYIDTDILVSRAGGGLLAEAATFGVPTIIIPSPNVSYDHQTYNAKYFTEKAAAIMINEADIKTTEFIELIQTLAHDVEKRKSLHDNMMLIAPLDAVTKMYEKIQEIKTIV